jgi:hypothetical protein
MRYWQSNVRTKSVPAHTHTHFTQLKYGMTLGNMENGGNWLLIYREGTACPSDIQDSRELQHNHLVTLVGVTSKVTSRFRPRPAGIISFSDRGS